MKCIYCDHSEIKSDNGKIWAVVCHKTKTCFGCRNNILNLIGCNYDEQYIQLNIFDFMED